jgi:glycosyltransferase involved in cell wall biosynthesis
MRVLHLAPLWFPVAADAVGGIETFTAGLIEGLDRLGCRNTLVASGDSRTAAELVPVMATNLVDMMAAGDAEEYSYYEQRQLLLALGRAAEFDVIHSSVGPGAYALSGVPGLRGRVLHSQHNPVTPDLGWFAGAHPDLWFSTVSEFQARALRDRGAGRCRVIPNGIRVDSFTFQPEGGGGLFFIGRIEWQKGPDLAVDIARGSGLPLTLAGPIIDEDFFRRAIEPHLGDQVRYVGKVDHLRKNELLGRAGCAVLPSRWDEPFGLVAIEAMACGTPVVALANGALPEVIDPGVTGFVARDEVELPALVSRALGLDRAAVRARAAARFDMPRVTSSYLHLYEEIAGASRRGPVGDAPEPPGHAHGSPRDR